MENHILNKENQEKVVRVQKFFKEGLENYLGRKPVPEEIKRIRLALANAVNRLTNKTSERG